MTKWIVLQIGPIENNDYCGQTWLSILNSNDSEHKGSKGWTIEILFGNKWIYRSSKKFEEQLETSGIHERDVATQSAPETNSRSNIELPIQCTGPRKISHPYPQIWGKKINGALSSGLYKSHLARRFRISFVQEFSRLSFIVRGESSLVWKQA